MPRLKRLSAASRVAASKRFSTRIPPALQSAAVRTASLGASSPLMCAAGAPMTGRDARRASSSVFSEVQPSAIDFASISALPPAALRTDAMRADSAAAAARISLTVAATSAAPLAAVTSFFSAMFFPSFGSAGDSPAFSAAHAATDALVLSSAPSATNETSDSAEALTM
jgi:hypothetical protein